MGYDCNPDTAVERFWSKVDRSGGPKACWNWIASKRGSGDGQFVATTKNMSAYRYSWIIHNGWIPKGKCVLHKCDNRACVNPKHLFLGTKRDNSEDMVAKGRQWKQPVTHCPQGHPYDEENTKIYQGRRYCRACARAWRHKGGNANELKTHCPQGHEYTLENTWRDSNNQRHCRTCNRERAARGRAGLSRKLTHKKFPRPTLT